MLYTDMICVCVYVCIYIYTLYIYIYSKPPELRMANDTKVKVQSENNANRCSISLRGWYGFYKNGGTRKIWDRKLRIVRNYRSCNPSGNWFCYLVPFGVFPTGTKQRVQSPSSSFRGCKCCVGHLGLQNLETHRRTPIACAWNSDKRFLAHSTKSQMFAVQR